MQKESRKRTIITGILFLVFLLFTVMVKTIDVQPVGPEGSFVGFAHINQFVFELFGVNLLWYSITDWLGAAAIAVPAYNPKGYPESGCQDIIAWCILSYRRCFLFFL